MRVAKLGRAFPQVRQFACDPVQQDRQLGPCAADSSASDSTLLISSFSWGRDRRGLLAGRRSAADAGGTRMAEKKRRRAASDASVRPRLCSGAKKKGDGLGPLGGNQELARRAR